MPLKDPAFLGEVIMKSNFVVKDPTGVYHAALYPVAAAEDIAAGTGGAISVATYYTTFDTDAGGDAFTLADGVYPGQVKKIQLITDGGGDGTLTPANLSGGTTITFADAGDFAVLVWSGSAWVAVELGNAADGVTAPVLA